MKVLTQITTALILLMVITGTTYVMYIISAGWFSSPGAILAFSIILNVSLGLLFTRILLGSFRFPSARRRSLVLIAFFLLSWLMLFLLGMNRKLQGSHTEASHILSSFVSRFTLEDGNELAYLNYLPDSSRGYPAVLYLHPGPGAYGLENEAATSLMSSLSQSGIPAFAYDRPGSGLSGRLNDPTGYSRERQLAYLHEILPKLLGSQKVVLLGESYGAVLATRYAALHPQKIAGLILLSPGPLYNRFTEGKTSLFSRLPMEQKKEISGMRSQFRVLTASLMSQRNAIVAQQFLPDEEADAWFSSLFLKMAPGGFCDSLRNDYPAGRCGFWSSLWTARNERGDTEAVTLSNIAPPFPVLILRGQCDYLPEETLQDYLDVFPQTEIQELKEAGHFMLNEKTEVIQRIIAQEMEKEY
jgi:proline iminopeptidase